ncbi:uncharacterized protein LOC123563851 [Mercenaria mercenaria]|uniref:uncharacterized protein LOC123563851 n=1 Tax=Mercenaria mercenaria TaxID=6596 RepID=UPI00234E51A8|nr:uncharacterized protein LOC123563851 [Mercenaria mercenaria]XP_053392540.1 uncharacterized protein LOC123563851 [Mercenaria mercenaria]
MNGTDFNTNITIQSGSDNSISEVNTISPVGLIKSSLALSNLTGNWHISVKWNPNKTDTVNNVFCFTAVDDSGLSSDQRCITLLAGVPPANIIASSKLPASHVVPISQRVWSIKFDQESKQTTKSAYIYLYHSNGTLVETIDVSKSPGITYSFSTNTTGLQFTTRTELQPGENYYFLFGQGLVQGKSYCGAESKSILDPNFWTFSTPKDVDVRCYKGYTLIPCEKSFLTCEDDWSFNNPCNKVNTLAGHTKIPHPALVDTFLVCDFSGKTYIAHCPPGEIFHAECSECAPSEVVSSVSCRTEAKDVENPCNSQSIMTGKRFFSYPGNTAKFIFCDVWGFPWEQQCQTGYLWDDIKKICVQKNKTK